MSDLVSPHESLFSEDIRHLCFEIANLEMHDLDKGELIVLNDDHSFEQSMMFVAYQDMSPDYNQLIFFKI